jgi:hypothetical protein
MRRIFALPFNRLVAGAIAFCASCFGTPAVAADIQYSLLLGTPLNDQSYRNSMHVDYYSIVTTTKYSKFRYLVIPAPSCTNFQFPEFVSLANKLVAANTSGMKLIFYMRPIGSEAWQSYPIGSTGCAPYGATPAAFYSNLQTLTGIGTPAVDLEGMHFPAGVDVGTGTLNYLTALAASAPAANPLWVANTAYAEKFQAGTGQFFTTDGMGHLTGNTTLPPSLIAQLGSVIWMDFHTMYAEHSPNARGFVDQRLAEVQAISGAQTAIQIGITCLNGKVSLSGTSDQQTMSTAVAQGETVLMDAAALGISTFNIYTSLNNLKSPQWKAFYNFMNTSRAYLPTVTNISWKPANKAGISYGVGCSPE